MKTMTCGFARALALAVSLTLLSAPVAASGSDGARGDIRPYRSLERVDVSVLSPDDAHARALVFFDTTPRVVNSGPERLAVSFEEHNAETVRMNVYTVERDGRYRLLDHDFAGFDSTQTFANYGVSLRVKAKLR